MTQLDAAPELLEATPAEERDARLAEGAAALTQQRGGPLLLGHPQLLVAVAATLMTTGVVVILLGWFGAARSTLVEEQVPYLISGGLLGVALAVVGALTLFTHWLTVMVRESRAHEVARRRDHEELVEALRALATTNQEGPNGRARGSRAERPLRSAPGGP